MKSKLISTKRLAILIVVITLFSSCESPQKSEENPITDTVEFEVKITHFLPVGWGYKYRASVEKIVDGNTKDFKDTIEFGLTASNDYEIISIGDICNIAFKNSKKISEITYLPAVTGTVSTKNEIWHITKIEKKNQPNKSRTFEGTAIESEGKAMFIWDLALSEAFYLDGLENWDEKYLNKKITIEAELIQFFDRKSILKNWKIVEDKAK